MNILEEIEYYMTEYNMTEEEAIRFLSMDDPDYDSEEN